MNTYTLLLISTTLLDAILVFPTNQMHMIVGYCFDAFLPPYITFLFM